LSAWTDVNLSLRVGGTSNSVVPVLDVNHVDTGYKFTFIEHVPDSHLQGIVDISANYSNYLKTQDPINSLFPVEVRKVNAEPSASGARSLVFALLKLDPLKIYNVTTSGWEYAGFAQNVCYMVGNNGEIASFNPSLNTSAFARITNLKAGMIPLTATSGIATDGYSDNKITFTIYTDSTSMGTKVAVCGFIIEECIDN
jgi:hypothetical protein